LSWVTSLPDGLHGCIEVPGRTLKSDTCAALMADYTPQLSTAVWLGNTGQGRRT
jgi:hypothetical protein